MKKKVYYISIYSYQYMHNVESIIMSTKIVIDNMNEGFEIYNSMFEDYVKCLKEGTLSSYLKKRKRQEKGIEISDNELNEIERFLFSPNEAKFTNELIKGMENALIMYKNVNYDNMKEFLYRSNLIQIFTEFENYLFRCIKFILLKYPKILAEKSITLKGLN